MKRREIIIWTEKELNRLERRNYKKEHPGKRLCFRLRFPNVPFIISVISLALVAGKPVLIYMLQKVGGVVKCN